MRKKLFAILMSAMMMVTFMPAMAFAGTLGDDIPQWNEKCASVDYGYTNYKTVREFDNDGYIVATSEVITGLTTDADDDWTDGTTVVEVKKDNGGSYTPKRYALQKKYVDLDGAYIAAGNGNGSNAIAFARKTAITQGEKTAYESTTANTVAAYVVTVKPTYATGDATMAVLDHSGWDFELDAINYDNEKMYEDQDFVLNVYRTAAGAHLDVFGSIASKSLKVLKGAPDWANLKYAVSGNNGTTSSVTIATGITSAGNKLVAEYDATAHVLSQVALPGFTSTFKVWDKTKGAYVAPATGEVSLTDAVSNYPVEVTATKAATATAVAQTKTFTLNVTVNKANMPFMQFDTSAPGKREFKVPADFDAAKYLVLEPATATTDKAKADKAAIAANEELLKAYFNDFFTIETTVDKYDANKYYAAIVAKTFPNITTAEKDAFVAKYAAMLANFTGVAYNRGSVLPARLGVVGGTPATAGNATFLVTGSAIDWVKAPLTKKYHNKKGTLKKTYTFQVEAKSEAKVTYKLQYGGEMIKIDKNTGKVTVKKGLKVGTYNVKVTATAGDATDSYYMTIKMAKK